MFDDIVARVLETEADGVVPIVTAGDPVLRDRARPYDFSLEPETFAHLVDVMRATMYDAPGVGLAAPQIGIPLQLAVIEDLHPVSEGVSRVRERTPQPFRVLINPRYTAIGAERRDFYEGCLSVPGYQAVVSRFAAVQLDCLDETGAVVSERFDGWPARIVQHETDHLGGTLYLDRAELRSLAANEPYGRLWNDPAPDRAAERLGFGAGSNSAVGTGE